MRKRKINQEYLRAITSTEIRNEKIDALAFALCIKEFVDDNLEGLVTAEVIGDRRGTVNLNLPVTSYLIRLIAMITDDDELIELKIKLDDELTIESFFHALTDITGVAHIVDVARLAGFRVDREGNTLFFAREIQSTYIMKIYAMSRDNFSKMLVTTYLM